MATRVSIITVCFNSAKTIARTLDSVRSQTWSDVEHIVIDGASNDGTQDIVAKYRTSIRYFASAPDAGIYDAMNKGLVQASGEIVCFLNSDDVYAHRDVVSLVVQTMEERKLDALYGDVVYFNSRNPEKVVRRFRSGRFSPGRLAWGWMPAHPALFMRSNVYRQTGEFDRRYKLAGDFDFVARAFSGNQLKADYLAEVLVRMQTGGISTSGWYSKLLLNQEVLTACRRNGIKTNMVKILSKYPIKMLELFPR